MWKRVNLCHCLGFLSGIRWSCAFIPFQDIWKDFPGFVCWYPGDNAFSTSDAGHQWGQPRRDSALISGSWHFCCFNGKRWDEVLTLMFRWKVGIKGFDIVVFWGFDWVTVTDLSGGELRWSPCSVIAGGCCWRGLECSFCSAFLPLLIWVTWGWSKIIRVSFFYWYWISKLAYHNFCRNTSTSKQKLGM